MAPSNPQSWNRYAYVINNPLANIDPLGLDYRAGVTGPDDYTTGCGGTVNLPPPCQIAPGVWDASYNDPTPDAQYLQNQTWQSVDTWFNNQGIAEYVPLPTGLLNYNANQGDLGMLGSQEMAIGFKEIVKKIQNDWIIYGLLPNATLVALSDSGGAALDALMIDLNVLYGLNGWKSVSVPAVPPAPRSMNAGLAMGVWKAQLLAWIKSHPGQAPPPLLLAPRSLSGVCG